MTDIPPVDLSAGVVAALSALDGLVLMVDFDRADPHSFAAALRAVDTTIDATMAAHRSRKKEAIFSVPRVQRNIFY